MESGGDGTTGAHLPPPLSSCRGEFAKDIFSWLLIHVMVKVESGIIIYSHQKNSGLSEEPGEWWLCVSGVSVGMRVLVVRVGGVEVPCTPSVPLAFPSDTTHTCTPF